MALNGTGGKLKIRIFEERYLPRLNYYFFLTQNSKWEYLWSVSCLRIILSTQCWSAWCVFYAVIIPRRVLMVSAWFVVTCSNSISCLSGFRLMVLVVSCFQQVSGETAYITFLNNITQMNYNPVITADKDWWCTFLLGWNGSHPDSSFSITGNHQVMRSQPGEFSFNPNSP